MVRLRRTPVSRREPPHPRRRLVARGRGPARRRRDDLAQSSPRSASPGPSSGAAPLLTPHRNKIAEFVDSRAPGQGRPGAVSRHARGRRASYSIFCRFVCRYMGEGARRAVVRLESHRGRGRGAASATPASCPAGEASRSPRSGRTIVMTLSAIRHQYAEAIT
jgi:hypothetical protein